MGLLLYLLRDVRMVHREGMQALAVRTHGRVPTIVSEPSIVPKKMQTVHRWLRLGQAYITNGLKVKITIGECSHAICNRAFAKSTCCFPGTDHGQCLVLIRRRWISPADHVPHQSFHDQT